MRLQPLLHHPSAGLVAAFFMVAGCLLATAGCRDGRPETCQVTGVVTYREKPVQDAHVTFTPKGNRSASGETDAEGRFTLLSFRPGDGAVAGEHVVCVAKAIPDPKGSQNSPYQKYVSLLPERYSSPVSSPLKANVTAKGPNDFHFDLTD